jgi:hypothetical protein
MLLPVEGVVVGLAGVAVVTAEVAVVAIGPVVAGGIIPVIAGRLTGAAGT